MTTQVLVNGQPREVPTGSTVTDLVRVLGLGSGPVAVEIDHQLVPRAQWTRTLEPGERVEIVAFIGGG